MKASSADILLGFMPRKLVGAMFMLLWALAFSTAMAFAKTLDPETPSLVIVFLRCLFGLMFFMPIAVINKHTSFKTKRPILHMMRIVFVCSSMACTYYAYRHLPLGLATSLGMTAPLITTMLAILILGDNVSWKKWLVIIIGYTGVLIMVRPDVGEIPFAVWIEILANVLAACSILSVKIMTRTESTMTIMLYANVATTALASLAVLGVWEVPKYDDLIALVAIGGLGMFSHYCSASALRYGNPSFLGPFEYTRMCFAIPIGYMFFDEVPTYSMIIGSIVIITATTLLTRLEMGETKKQVTAP
jgi:drug/metabolite transporter (DMT)-like permease